MKPARSFEELRSASSLDQGAVLSGGAWRQANLAGMSFDGAEVSGSDFTGSDMERVTFRGARVRDAKLDGVRFGSALFDRSVFERCSFRDASFAKLTSEPEPTTTDAYFIDCDFTGTDWTDRSMSGATFLRCKLAGARGKPKATDGLVVQACDCDADTFLAALAGDASPNKTPRTDSELRLAASKVPCETCGAAPPEKLDIFRAGLRAVLGGKCPYCTKARSITFTVDAHPPPAEPARMSPPIPASPEVMTASPANYCQRILDSIARWDAQDRAMVAALVTKSAPTTFSLASYTTGARQVVVRAQALADERKHVLMTAIHVLACLLAQPPVQERVRASGADPDAALAEAESWLKDRPRSGEPSCMSSDAIAMLNRADKEADGKSVSLIHLVTAFIAPPPRRATVEELDKHGTGVLQEEDARQRIIAAGRLDRFAR